jgi:carbohydrate binding protein with CBM11 domain
MLPAAPRTLPPPPDGLADPVRGVIHVHTTRSDGTGSVDEVLRAAAGAGLKFVIVTDHGDGTRAPDLPDYRNGVLYIDAVEVSTRDGHVVALGIPKTPYPLAGEGRDVVEDIHRLGGIAIAAHPGSPKSELQWTDWNAPIDGLEWLNADSEWRDERGWTLVRALISYPFRPPQSLALLLDRPEPVLRRWDELTQRRPVFAVAGSDAHARVGARSLGEPYDSAGSLHFPSYTNSFHEFSISLSTIRLTGNADADARRVLDAIRGGHMYSAVDALAGPTAVRMTAASGSRTASMGDTLPVAGPVHLQVDAQAPGDATITLFRNGASVATGQGMRLDHDAPAEPAVYRIEIALPDAPGIPPVPWVVGNPIYVGRGTGNAVTAPQAPARAFTTLYDGGPVRGWRIEKNAASDAAMDVIGAQPGTQLLLRFAISGTAAENPYVAFMMPATTAIAMYERLMFTARADRPMRISVQLRKVGGAGERWRRSVYLDTTTRTVDIPFSDFRDVEPTNSALPVLSQIDSILFVVDTVNTKMGSNGEIQIDDIKYAR